MTQALAKLQVLIGTALVLAFFSEFYFVNEGPVFDLLAALRANPATAVFGFGELVLYYALFAYPFLIAFGNFGGGDWRGLLLAGGLYGLAAEALVVPVVYEAPPFSFVWTSLSWHTLIDVMLGWWLLRVALRAGALWAWGVPLALGLFWGVWATWFWAEAPETVLRLGEFTAVAWFTGVALMVGIWLTDRAPASAFRAGWIEIAVVAVISLAIFAMTALPYLPFLPLAVLALAGLAVLGLRALKGRARTVTLAALDSRPPAWRYLLVLGIPAAATVSYAMVLDSGFQLESEFVVLPLLVAGAVSFLYALAAAALHKIRER